MDNTFMIIIVIAIAIVTILHLFFFLSFGKKRHEAVLGDLRKVSSVINDISGSVTNNERQAVSRDNSLRSLISRNQQKLENNISQSSKSNESRIEYMEERVTNEIQLR